MKSQITKIVSLLVCVCLIVSGMILSTSAAESSATITFDNTNKRTEVSTAKQVWVENGITVTNNKGTGSDINAQYYNPLRLYKNTNVVIEYSSAITKIEFTANSTTYATSLKTSIGTSQGTAVASGTKVTFTPTAPATSFTFTLSDAQTRINNLTVYYETAGGEGAGGNGGSGAGGTTPPPASSDPAADSTLTIPEALALGETKDHNNYTSGKYYVEGVISSVSNETFGNMTIKDANNNSLTIYGSYDADGTNRYDAMTTKPVAGDTVKLYGIIGKYSTTVQMKNAWIVAHTPGTPPVNNDPAADSTLTIPQALEVGGTKEHNTYTSGKYYVEGVISSVSNEEYGNMTIKDANNNSLTIYGSYDADGTNRYDAMATKPVAGDTVKLYGIIGKYSTTVQMKNAWIVAHTPGTPPVNNDPAADTVLTVKAAAELGASKDPNAYTTGKYYVTGTIKSIANDVYGNMTIEDSEGNELYVYGTYNEDGSVRYDALTEQPQVGDTVTVYGIIGQYNGTAQMKNGWFKAAPAGGNTGAGTGTGTGTGSATGTNTGSATTTAPEKSPETGDSIALYIVMMAISAAAMVLVAKKRFA